MRQAGFKEKISYISHYVDEILSGIGRIEGNALQKVLINATL